MQAALPAGKVTTPTEHATAHGRPPAAPPSTNAARSASARRSDAPRPSHDGARSQGAATSPRHADAAAATPHAPRPTPAARHATSPSRDAPAPTSHDAAAHAPAHGHDAPQGLQAGTAAGGTARKIQGGAEGEDREEEEVSVRPILKKNRKMTDLMELFLIILEFLLKISQYRG